VSAIAGIIGLHTAEAEALVGRSINKLRGPHCQDTA